MTRLGQVREALQEYTNIEKAPVFFSELGYNIMKPLPAPELDRLPDRPRELLKSLHLIADYAQHFRIYHAQLAHDRIRRTDIRMVLEAFYRHFPQLNALFVFTTSETPYREFAFVSPVRLRDHRDPMKVRLWLRTLAMDRTEPFRTDLEILDAIRLEPPLSPEGIWRKHEEAFSIQRVTDRFFDDYQRIFYCTCDHLNRSHKDKDPSWVHDYAHLLLNRIMFLYFIQRKEWLLGKDGTPDRHFMRHLWEAYKEAREDGRAKPDTFHWDWLHVLFFEAFNNRWQKQAEYLGRFPGWLIDALSQAPYLNGGLFTKKAGLDDQLSIPLPDEMFELLFERWVDGTFPGFFERYNFTVVESGGFDEEVAVDPEMMGKIYERLVNITFEGISVGDHRGTAGIFYTPRTEIDLMCRLSLTDYLTNHFGENHRPLITEWMFAYTSEEKEEVDKSITEQRLWQPLYELVRSVTVCDPAVGSGSFLVGMLLILDDLQERCQKELRISETPYERRRRIIGEQLYGVDVMEWAVRVAELRLWLQLVVETELDPAELKFHPLLPNLSFKVQHGDSLLQEVGELNFSRFRRRELPVPTHLKDKLAALKDKKQRFYSGENRELTEDALRQEEVQVLREILQHRLDALEQEISQGERAIRETKRSHQASIPGLPTTPGNTLEIARGREELEERLKQKREEQRRVKEAREALSNAGKAPFIWDLAFAEIFEGEKGGFDIVIGNPPYVRQEKISDPLGHHSRDEYLNRVQATLSDLYPAFFRGRFLSRRSDYYVYFYLHGLSLLNEKGSFSFVTSNSWLDVDFGKDLQEFLLKHSHIRAIIDNRAKRSFAQADVNTVIVLLAPPTQEPLSEEEMARRRVRFITFKVPFEEGLSPVIFLEIAGAEERMDRHEFRMLVKDQWTLFLEGSEPPEEGVLDFRPSSTVRYTGNKWGGKYLRAPDIFFTILEKGGGKLVSLGDIAEVRFGIKTGANDWFFVKVEDTRRDGTVRIRCDDAGHTTHIIETRFVRYPVVTKAKEIEKPLVSVADLPYRVVLVDVPNDKIPKHLADYIRWGEAQPRAFHRRKTCAQRARSGDWYRLEQREPPHLIIPIGHKRRPVVGVIEDALAGDNFVEVRLHNEDWRLIVAACLYSTFTLVNYEIFGRANFGQGLLKTQTFEIASLPVPNPTVLSPQVRQRLEWAFKTIAKRPPLMIYDDVRRVDRVELDDAFLEAVGFTDAGERQVLVKELHDAACRMIWNRMAKSGTARESRQSYDEWAATGQPFGLEGEED